MTTVNLSLQQRRLANLGKMGANIAEARKASAERTAQYYSRVLTAVDKGDTVEIGKLHSDYRKSENGVTANLRQKAEKQQKLFQATLDKIIGK